MSDRSRVLIVGAGPTGLTAALELSRFGIPLRIVDRAPAAATTSRAIGVQARTLEQLELRGLADEFVRKGNPAAAASVYGDGKRLFRLDFEKIESRYNFLLFVSQAETERILTEALERRGVTIERGVELVAIAQDALARDAHAAATLRHADGTLEETTAPYLISAEGAHSVVRTTLDLHFEGKTREEHYALGDFYVDGPLSESDFHIFSSAHGFLGMFPMGGGRFRLIASNPLSEPDPKTRPSLDELQAIYDQRSPIAVTFRDSNWSSWFAINSRMVPRLRVGRFFLGGDAAHIHSPAGAQGMNTGIADMMDLAWKLAFVLEGRAAPALLDTYEADRLPVMRGVLANTERLTDQIGASNPIERAVFDHVAPWLVGTPFVQEKATANMSQIAVAYRESPLSANHGCPGALRAGDRVPDVPLETRSGTDSARASQSTFGLLDPTRYTLLFTNPSDPHALHERVASALAGWHDLISGIHVVPPADEAGRRRFESHFGRSGGLLLVRPDGYVGFAGAEASVDDLVAYGAKWHPLATPSASAATGAKR